MTSNSTLSKLMILLCSDQNGMISQSEKKKRKIAFFFFSFDCIQTLGSLE